MPKPLVLSCGLDVPNKLVQSLCRVVKRDDPLIVTP